MTTLATRPMPRRLFDQPMQALTDRLIAEYREYLPIGSIVRCVARSIDAVGRLDRPGRLTDVERVARERLERRLGGGSWVAQSAVAGEQHLGRAVESS